MDIPLGLRRYLIIGFIIIVVLAVVVSATVVGYTMLSKAAPLPDLPSTTTLPQTNKLAPPTPNQQSSPAAQPKIAIAPVNPIIPPVNPTISGWSTTGSGSVDIVPSFSTDYHNLYVDFQSFSLFQITSIDYSLTYTADPGVIRMVKGSVNPAADQAIQTSGKPTIRKIIALGTCSGTNCTYDSNSHNFTLTNLIKSNNGLTINLKTLTLSGMASASGAL